ncbi:MAG: hypothetical protein AB8B64_19185 [Granulosicoccus sp.]
MQFVTMIEPDYTMLKTPRNHHLFDAVVLSATIAPPVHDDVISQTTRLRSQRQAFCHGAPDSPGW